jgi:hypothetical protein
MLRRFGRPVSSSRLAISWIRDSAFSRATLWLFHHLRRQLRDRRQHRGEQHEIEPFEPGGVEQRVGVGAPDHRAAD